MSPTEMNPCDPTPGPGDAPGAAPGGRHESRPRPAPAGEEGVGHAARVRGAVAVSGPSAFAAEAELTDREWLETRCDRLRALLRGHPASLAKFDRDAIFYRRDREDRYAYKAKARARLAAVKKLGVPYARMVGRLLRVSHPDDWLLCGACRGAGRGDAGECGQCYGAGYVLSFEPD